MKRLLLAGFVASCALAGQADPGKGSIEGKVLNSLTGAPIRKATVELTASQIWLAADTDAGGKFQFFGLPAGTYRLSATHSGFFDRPVRRIRLGADEHLADAEVRLLPKGAISGHILDEDRDPVDRARVWVFKQVFRDGRKQWEKLGNVSQTTPTGEYRFPDLRPGRYLVQAETLRQEVDNRYGDREKKPRMVHVPTYYPNAAGEQDAVPVDMGAGAEVRGIDIHLSTAIRPPLGPAVRVKGKVTGVQPGSRLVIMVSLIRADSGSPEGHGLAEPPDYTFDLSARPGPHTIHANVYSGGPTAYASASLTVTEDVSGVVLAMSPPAYVTGQFRMAENESKRKLQGVAVSLQRHGDSNVYYARSDAEGKFAFPEPIRPGTFAMNVEARSLPEDCFVQEAKLGGGEVALGDVEIPASANFDFVLSGSAGILTGSVADDNGKPFPDSSVTLIPPEGKSRLVRQSADGDGNFRIAGLRPGKYKLFAWEEVDDDLWQDPDFRRKYENRATEITLGARETQNVRLRVVTAEDMK